MPNLMYVAFIIAEIYVFTQTDIYIKPIEGPERHARLN